MIYGIFQQCRSRFAGSCSSSRCGPRDIRRLRAVFRMAENVIGQPAGVIILDTEIHSSGDGFIHTPVVRLKHIPDMLPAPCMRPSSAYLPSAGRMKRGLPPAGLEKNNRG